MVNLVYGPEMGSDDGPDNLPSEAQPMADNRGAEANNPEASGTASDVPSDASQQQTDAAAGAQQDPRCIQSGGTYRITNVKGGTVLDLAGYDNRSSKPYILLSQSLQLNWHLTPSHWMAQPRWVKSTGWHNFRAFPLLPTLIATQWTINKISESGWTFKSARSGEYLGFSGNATDGTRLITVPFPYEWGVADQAHNYGDPSLCMFVVSRLSVTILRLIWSQTA